MRIVIAGSGEDSELVQIFGVSSRYHNRMSSHPCLIRMDSASYTCCYGNDVYSYQVRCPVSSLIFFPGDIQDAEAKM